MNVKHQFKYTYTDTDIAEISPVDITFDMPGDVTITQMLFNFECYLRACGFVFDGQLEMVSDAYAPFEDELDGTLHEFKDEELHGAYMTDFDAECGCSTSQADQKLHAWNAGLAKLERDMQEDRDKASNRADELHQMNERWQKISKEQQANMLVETLKASGIKEVNKNKWVHGMCNPPASDHSNCSKNK